MSQPQLMDIRGLSQLLGRTKLDNVSIFGKPHDKARESKLFTFDTQHGALNVETSEDVRDHVHSICERAGLFKQQMEYFPPGHNRLQVLAGHIRMKFNDIRDPDWYDWFLGLVKDKSVIPDTNILLHHTLSSHILPIVPLKLMLSRISILELEALAHRDNDDQYTNKPSIRKRNSIWAFAEVRELLDKKAELLPPLPSTIITNFTSFTKIAGTGFADEIIRQEISNNPVSSALVLLTNDFVNALTAMAENIEVFHISAVEPDKTTFAITSNDQLSHALMEASISYAQIKLKDAQSKEIMTIEGMWSGKTWDDFHHNMMLVTSP